MHQHLRHWYISALMVFLCLGVAPGSQPQPPSASPPAQAMSGVEDSTSPNELVAKVVDRELQARDDFHFMYRDWRQTPEGSKTKENVETTAGVVARLIAIDDHPLTLQQQAEEDARLQNLMRHPELQRQKEKEQRQDEERVSKMFRELPKAFLYQYDGTEQGPSGQLLRLKFVPNPRYEPPSRETSVFRAMSGKLWVALPDYRLGRIEAMLFREMTFGWGILGHLDKGGHFYVEQSKIAPDRWDVTYMNIQFSGKILLFKTINLREIEKLSDFHQVPNDLSLAQGIELLRKNGAQLAATTSP